MKIATDEAHEADQIELNMTSMIDIVFLLLIFFVMTLSFPEAEANLPAHLPKRGIGSGGDPPRTPELVVGLGYAGNHLAIVINGKDIGDSMGLLQRKLALFRSTFSDGRVTIDSAPDVPYQYVVSTLNSCAKLGIVKVRFAQPRDNA